MACIAALICKVLLVQSEHYNYICILILKCIKIQSSFDFSGRLLLKNTIFFALVSKLNTGL